VLTRCPCSLWLVLGVRFVAVSLHGEVSRSVAPRLAKLAWLASGGDVECEAVVIKDVLTLILGGAHRSEGCDLACV